MSAVVGSGRMALPSGAVVPSIADLQSITAATPGGGDGCGRFGGAPGPIAFSSFGASASQTGAMGALEIVDGPTRCGGWSHVAIKANGSGLVRAFIRMAAIGVKFSPLTTTWGMSVNGIVVASASTFQDGGLSFWGSSWSGWLGPFDVGDGDLITVEMALDGPIPAFFSVDDFAAGGPGLTGLYIEGDLVSGTLNRRMRGSGAV